MGEVALEVRRLRHSTHAGARAQFRHGRYLDEQDIEEKSARRRIWARLLRRIEKHRVQGIKPDHRGAEIGGELGEAFEIAEIADAPIVLRAQQIKLKRDAPDRPFLGQAFGNVTTLGNDDQAHFSGLEPARFDPQPVIADLRRSLDNEAAALDG